MNTSLWFSILLYTIFFLLLSSSSVSYDTPDDFECLRTLKESIEDPFHYLNSWNFNDTTESFVCRFNGIDCWNAAENKVLSIGLSGMGLKGQFPKGLDRCGSLTMLDLSNNMLTGPIPSNISKSLPFLTYLDLSFNNFSGEIPLSLSNCTYLNILKLNNNQLTGQIPWQLGQLYQLKIFNVSGNLLSGQIPTFVTDTSFEAESYANNERLCGEPLKMLPHSNTEEKISHTALIIGSAVGFVVGVVMFKFMEKAFKKEKTLKVC